MSTTTGGPTRTLDQVMGNGPRAAQGTQFFRPPARRGEQGPVAPEAGMPQIHIGLDTLQSFELSQRIARMYASSTVVPKEYRMMIPARRNKEELVENPSALANCVIALNIAARLRVDPLMVMQNLDVIEGRPSWRAQFVTGMINNSGRFSGMLRYRETKGPKKVVEFKTWEWGEARGQKVYKTERIEIHNDTCVAYAVDKATGEPIEGPEISVELAVLEGWYTKDGSKWPNMTQTMLRYRAAAWFGRNYAPDLLMGFPLEDETREILDAERSEEGNWSVPEAEPEPAAASPATVEPASAQAAPAVVEITPAAPDPSAQQDAAAKVFAAWVDADGYDGALDRAAKVGITVLPEWETMFAPLGRSNVGSPAAATRPDAGPALPLRGGARKAAASAPQPQTSNEISATREILRDRPRYEVTAISGAAGTCWAFLDHRNDLHEFVTEAEANDESVRLRNLADFPGDQP